jgi:TrmH family RNA methyltransferase
VAEALAAGWKIRQIYATTAFLTTPEERNLVKTLETVTPVETVSATEMKRISQTRTPSGILGICPLPAAGDPVPALMSTSWLYLDHISDPGNLGTLLRTAAWFGLKAVALSSDCSDPFNPKVVRGGMGAHFHLKFLGPLPLKQLTSRHQILGADHRGTPIRALESIPEPWVLVVGNEAHGLSPSTHSRVNQLVSVPKRGQGESLNVGVATGIILHHLTA